MNNSFKLLLKTYLSNNQYEEYNEILRKEIISMYVNKIQEKNASFLYSNIIELLEAVDRYLDKEDILNFNYFYNLLKQDYEEKYLTEYLTRFYKKIKS